MTGIIVALIIGATILLPVTGWLLSLNAKVSRMDDSLEGMTVGALEWQRLEHMSLDELEANRENYKTPYNVGEKFKVGVTLGEQGFFDEGKCNALTGAYASESPNCFKDTILTVFDADGNSLYTTRSLPLSAGSGDNFPEGTILPYTGDLADIPRGWVLCDGTNGTPDLRGKFLEGTVTTTGEFKEAGLPNILGGYNAVKSQESINSQYGAFDGTVTSGIGDSSHGGNWHHALLYLRFNASHSNPIYGKSDTVQPSSFTVFYIMKINTDFHYDHTNGFVSPDYYTKDEVDSLLADKETKYNNTFLPIISNKYVHNDTEDYTLSLGYNSSTGTMQAFVNGSEKFFAATMPKGTILPYVGKIADIPTGWHLCDGNEGTPNLLGRVLQSYDESHNVGDFVDAGLPNITGSLYFSSRHNLGASGAFRNSYSGTSGYWNSSDGITYVYSTFDASRSNSIYGNSTTVQPPAYIVCYIIKMS